MQLWVLRNDSFGAMFLLLYNNSCIKCEIANIVFYICLLFIGSPIYVFL